jgi:hypothetical protein
MYSVSELIKPQPDTHFFGPARVLANGKTADTLRVRLLSGEERRVAIARTALQSPVRLNSGDEVLVIGQDTGEVYIIGILKRKMPSVPPSPKLETQSGASVTLDGAGDEQIMRVFSPTGELVFEYDPKAGKARMTQLTGDFEFVAPHGDITLCAGRDVRLAGRTILLNSRAGIQLAVQGAAQRLRSCFTLSRRKAKIQSENLELESQRGDVRIENSRFSGQKTAGNFGQVRWVVSRLETTADTIIQKTGNFFQKVETLAQLNAGRVRSLIRSTFHLKANKAYMKSEKDFKVDGEKIHLG